MAALVSPQYTASVARPRLRRQSSSESSGKKQAGSTKKPPQRGLGVAELERLRCGGDQLLDLNAVAAVAMGAAAANAQGHPVGVQHQLPAFDATTGLRYYSPLVIQPPSPAPPAPPSCWKLQDNIPSIPPRYNPWCSLQNAISRLEGDCMTSQSENVTKSRSSAVQIPLPTRISITLQLKLFSVKTQTIIQGSVRQLYVLPRSSRAVDEDDMNREVSLMWMMS